MDPLLTVLFEDEDLLVVDKPAGLVCHPSKAGPRSSLIGRVRLHLGAGDSAHLVNRLDRETSGVVVVAKGDTVARELGRVWSSRQVRKQYAALVHGHVREATGRIEAPLGKDVGSRVAIKDCVRADGAAARTDFARRAHLMLATAGGPRPASLLELAPHTGRKHQLRIHLAHIGHPVVGDKLYGGCEDDYLALVEDRLTGVARDRLILACHALRATGLDFAWRDRAWRFRCAEPFAFVGAPAAGFSASAAAEPAPGPPAPAPA